MKKVLTEFKANSDSESREMFFVHLGDGCAWFGEALYAIKEEWINNGYQVTDILIRENRPIYVASIKAYVPFASKKIPKMPTREDIIMVVDKFTEKKKSFDGATIDFSFYVMGLGIFRVNYSADASSVGLSIRYLTFQIPTFDSINYPSFYAKTIKNVISANPVQTPGGTINVSSVNSGGLILHVGATGSGKTTSIAAEIGYIAESTTGVVITYENPIEYRYIATKAPVRQYEIDKDIKGDDERTVFENIKRHLLRNNPSVVLIGEARDNSEIKAMLDFAARGHLVFGTIHSSNVKEALTTLMAVSKNEPYLLANSLQAIVAHKLIMSTDGSIVPLFEILIPDITIKTNLAKGDMSAINRSFYTEKTLNTGKTFSQSLEECVQNKKITPAEARDIKVSNYGLFG